MVFLVSYPYKGGTTVAIDAGNEDIAREKFKQLYPHIIITKIEEQPAQAPKVRVAGSQSATNTAIFDSWLRTVPVHISIEAKEEDDAKVQADYLSWTKEHLTDDAGNLLSGYSLYRGGPKAVASRYGTIFRMQFPLPPDEIKRPEFLSRLNKPIQWVTLKDGRMELAATDYIKYLLCNGFRVGLNESAITEQKATKPKESETKEATSGNNDQAAA